MATTIQCEINAADREYYLDMKPSDLRRYLKALPNTVFDPAQRREHRKAIKYLLDVKRGVKRRGRPPARAWLM